MQWKELSDDLKTAFEKLQLHQLGRLVVDDKVICVTRLEDGYFGIQNTCPHAGAQLHHGHCNKRGIIGCPLHGYKFDMRTGRSADGNNYKITNYRFRVENGKLYMGY
jgi:3-phenylpropionate/trans-cinnamate dioxygenase ferredoxin subunit